jgi:hypothetical protein
MSSLSAKKTKHLLGEGGRAARPSKQQKTKKSALLYLNVHSFSVLNQIFLGRFTRS